MKMVKTFRLKIVIFTALNNRCMLHGRVFVMKTSYRYAKFKFSSVAYLYSVSIGYGLCFVGKEDRF